MEIPADPTRIDSRASPDCTNYVMLGPATQKTCATSRVTTTASPSSKTYVSRNCAVPRFHAPSIIKRDKRASIWHISHVQGITHHVSHVKTLPRGPHTSKFVCLRLRVVTAIWRTVIHCLLHDSTTYTVCCPGVEFPPLHIHLSVI